MTDQPHDTEARYLADRFEWAVPGDQQHDAWLVRFCDKDCREAIFTGPDAERDALALGVLHDRPARSEPVFAIDGSLMREMSGLTEAEFTEAWNGWHQDDAIPNHCRKDW